MVSSHLCVLVTPHAARHAANAASGSSGAAAANAAASVSSRVGAFAVPSPRARASAESAFARVSAFCAAAAPSARNAASRAARTASGIVQRVSLVSRLWKYARPSGATASFHRVVASARSVAVIKHAGLSYVDLPVDALCQYLRRPSGAVCSVQAEAASGAFDAIGAPAPLGGGGENATAPGAPGAPGAVLAIGLEVIHAGRVAARPRPAIL